MRNSGWFQKFKLYYLYLSEEMFIVAFEMNYYINARLFTRYLTFPFVFSKESIFLTNFFTEKMQFVKVLTILVLIIQLTIIAPSWAYVKKRGI